MGKPTPEMIADPALGTCKRMRPGCGELGEYKPFYQGYVCKECLAADSADVLADRNPPGNMGIGKLFRQGSEDDQAEG
jgi:hypothetical protein